VGVRENREIKPLKQVFFSFPTYQSPSERRSASQKRTLGFYSAKNLVYFGNRAAYRAHLKKVCKSAAFFAHFCLPAPGSRELLRRRNRYAGSQVPGPGSTPPKTVPLFNSVCQSPSKKGSAVQLGLFRPFFLRCKNAPGNLISTPFSVISSPAWGKLYSGKQGSPSEKPVCRIVCPDTRINPHKTALLFRTTCRSPSRKRSAAGTVLLAAFSYGVKIPKIREFVRVLHE